MASPVSVTGAPAAVTTDPGAGGGQPTGAPTTPTGAVNPGPGAPEVKEYKFKEDRSDWIPPHRLSETSRKVQEATDRATQLERDLETERKRVRAAMGIDPQDPKAEEAAQVREALKGVLTDMGLDLDALKGLTKAQVQQLLTGSQQATSAANTLYDRHRDEMFDKVEGAILSKIGVEKLSERQTDAIRTAYARACGASYQLRERLVQQGRESEIDENDFIGRHLRSDPKLVTEFVAEFLGDWYEPARRNVTQSVVRRQSRPVPSGGRGEAVVTKMAEIDFSDDKKFSDALLSARRSGA